METINNNQINDNTIEPKKSKFDRKIWNQNNLDKKEMSV
jgi:hypothetical protein